MRKMIKILTLTTYMADFSLIICSYHDRNLMSMFEIESRNHYEFSRSNHDVVTAVLLTAISVRRVHRGGLA